MLHEKKQHLPLNDKLTKYTWFWWKNDKAAKFKRKVSAVGITISLVNLLVTPKMCLEMFFFSKNKGWYKCSPNDGSS